MSLVSDPASVRSVLPSVLADDSLALSFADAFDAAAAPIVSLLDNFAAYLDPATTSWAMLEMLSRWVGADRQGLDEDGLRRMVKAAGELHIARGTAKGLEAMLALVAGVPVEVQDSGGIVWRERLSDAPPVDETPSVTVRFLGRPEGIRQGEVRALIEGQLPIGVRVEGIERSRVE